MDESNPFASLEGGLALAEAIVDSLSDPLVVLDDQLRIVAASRSFLSTFVTTEAETRGRSLYQLGEGRWDTPALRDLLNRVLPERTGVGEIEGIEVEIEIADLGPRIMLLNARMVHFETGTHRLILIAMRDVTAWRSAEKAMRDLLRDKDLLLREMQHRVANSLQIIASILLLKARGVQSDEAREHLRDAHQRVMAVADVQREISGGRPGEAIEIAPYIDRLATKLGDSMISPPGSIKVRTELMPGEAVSGVAVSMGLIVTELILNAVKHAFPGERTGCEILVEYGVTLAGWMLAVSDNGTGIIGTPRPGLGTSIVEALVQRLDATMKLTTGPGGTRIEINHTGVAALAAP